MKTRMQQTALVCAQFAWPSRHAIAGLLIAIAMASAASAQTTATWYGSGTSAVGGTGTWNTTLTNWSSDGTSWFAWSNTTNGTSTAVFAGTSGTVTLGAAITAGGLQFDTTGYTITGNTLTLAGAAPQISVSSGLSGTVSSAIAGTAGLRKVGSGTLTLTAASNGYTGGTIVDGGVLSITAYRALGTSTASAITINTGTLELAVNGDNALGVPAQPVTINAGGALRGAATTAGATNLSTLTLNGGRLESNAVDSGLGKFLLQNVVVGGSTQSEISAISVSISSGSFTVNDVTAGTDLLVSSKILYQTWAGPLVKAGAGTMVLTGANTYTGTTTVSAGDLVLGSGSTAGSISNSSPVSVSAGATFAFNRSDSLTYGGTIGGAGNLAQRGSGVVILSGTNTYTGTTTIASGTLQIGAGGATGSISDASPVINSGVLAFNRSNSLTYGGTVSGLGGLSKAGSSLLSLTGANTYTGTTSITTGTLQIGNGGTAGSISDSSPVSVSSGAVLAFNRSDNLTYSGTVSGAGGLLKSGTNLLSLAGANTFSGTTTIAGGILSLGSANALGGGGNVVFTGGTLQFTSSNTADLSARILNSSSAVAIDTNGQSVTFATALGASNTGGLRKVGSGTLTLTSNNSFTGGTTIDGGVLQLANQTTSALSSGPITINTGTLELATNNFNALNFGVGVVAVTVNAGGVLRAANTTKNAHNLGTLTLNGGRLESNAVNDGNGNFLLRDVIVGGATQSEISAISVSISSGSFTVNDVTAGTDLLVSSQILYQSWASPLVKTGAGTMVLTGANTYTGTTTVSAGDLVLGSGSTTGSISNSSPVSVSSGATFAFNRSDSLTYGGTVSGAGNLAQRGSGTLALTGSNAFSGTTTIAGGVLSLGNANALGGGGNVLFTGGTLQFTSSNTADLSARIQNSTSAVAIDTNSQSGTFASGLASSNVAGLTKSGAGTLTLAASNAFSGTTTIAGGTLQIGNGGTTGAILDSSPVSMSSGAVFAFNRSDNLTYGGTVSGAGSLAQLGSNVLILTQNQSYTGTTTIASGTLQIGNGGTTGSISDASPVANRGVLAFNRSDALTYGGAVSGTGGLTMAGSSVLSLTGANTYTGATTITSGTLQVGAGGTTGSIVGASPVSVASGAVFAFNRSDNLTYGGTVNGAGGLVKLGAGTLALSGANTYAGTTTITSGTLQIGVGGATGSIADASPVSVASGAVFAFNRSDSPTYGGTVSGAGGLVKLGAGNLTLTGSNSYTGGTRIDGGIVYMNVPATPGSTSALGTSTSSNVITINSGTLTSNGGLRNWLDSATAIASGGGNAHSLVINAGGVLSGASGWVTGLGNVTMNGGTIVVTTGVNDTFRGSFVLGGDISVSGSVASSITNTGNVNAVMVMSNGAGGSGGTRTFTVNDVTNSSASDLIVIARLGDGTVIKAGAGTLELAPGGVGTPVTPVNWQVNAGTLLTTTTAAISTGTVTLASSSTFDLGGQSGVIVGRIVAAGSLLNSSTSAASTAAPVDLSGTNTAQIGGPGSLTLSGTISNGGFTKVGAGTLFLSGSNTYAGATTVASGTLQIGNGGATGSIANASPVSVASGAAFAFNRSDNLTYGGTVSGAGGLVKLGSNALAITGIQAYTGATSINGGRLEITSSGRINGTSGITIDGSGAELKYNSATALTQPITFTQGTLSGTGVIGTLVTVGTNDIIAPGNSPGIQPYAAGLSWAPGGTYEWEFNAMSGTPGTNWDLVDVTSGTFSLAGLSTTNTFLLDLITLTGGNVAGPLDSPYVPGSTYSFLIADFGGSTFTVPVGYSTAPGSDLTGLFSFNLTKWQGTAPSVNDISVKVNSLGTGIELVVVPEPGTLALAGMAIVGVGWMVRRKRRAAA